MAKATTKKVTTPKAKAVVAAPVDPVSLVNADGDTLAAAIADIAKRSEANRSAIMLVAPACIEHAVLHGNVTPLTNLFIAIGPDARRKDFVTWALHFGPVRWIEGKEVDGVKTPGSFGMVKDKAVRDDHEKRLADNRLKYLRPMVERPYWVFTPEPEIEGFSFPKALAALIQKGKKRMNDKDEAKRNHKDNDFAGIDDAEKLAAAIIAKKTTADVEVTVH